MNNISSENTRNISDLQSISEKFEDITNTNTTLESRIKELEVKLQEKEAETDKLKNELETNELRVRELSKVVTFDVNNVGSPSQATPSHLRRALKGTALESLADAFVTAEHDTGVNAIFLAALAANEGGWGESARASSQNNITGYKVYTDYSRGEIFSSKDECILQTATEIKNNYLTPGGSYYNGVSLGAINIKYSQIDGGPNPNWYNTINSIANSLTAKANNITN